MIQMSDPYGGFEFTDTELKAGLKPPIMSLLSGEEYAAVSRQAAGLVEDGLSHALYAPAVNVIVDSALSAVNLPSVQQRLPLEVGIRRNIALYCAEYATNIALMLDIFNLYYGGNQDLMPLSANREKMDDLRDNEYLSSIGKAPFLMPQLQAVVLYA